MRSFEESIFGKLREIQVDRPDYLISLGLYVTEEFGLAQSFRRGAATAVQNAGVTEADINWICRWKKGGGDGTSPYFQGCMRIHYSDTRQMTRMLL